MPDPEDPILSYMRANDWERENEELRGIIDDLTLDIRHMKRKLRRYQEANPRHLRDDKLFEIRAHRLSVRRKRQLENILERFAAGISMPPRLSKGRRAVPKTDSLHVEDARMRMLVMLIECLCSSNTSHNASSFESGLISDNRDGWFSINEMLDFIEQASLPVSQGKFNLEALKQHSTQLHVSADGNYLRWKQVAADSSSELSNVSQENQAGCQDSAKSQTSGKAPLGLDKIDMMSTIKKNPYYTPCAFLQHESEIEIDKLSMDDSEAESATQVTIVRPNSQEPNSSKLSSDAPYGKTAYYRSASFYIDYSCDSLVHAEPIQNLQESDQRRKRRRLSENHVSNRFAAYNAEYNENRDDYQNDPRSPGIISLNEEPLSPVIDGTKAQPIELEASGVGDVIPGDNFAVHVTVKHTSAPALEPVDAVSAISIPRAPENRLSRNRIIPRPDIHGTCKAHVVTSIHEELEPSPLPPPISGSLSSASSDDEKESSSSEQNCGGYGVDKPKHAVSIQQWRAAVVSSLDNDDDGALPGGEKRE